MFFSSRIFFSLIITSHSDFLRIHIDSMSDLLDYYLFSFLGFFISFVCSPHRMFMKLLMRRRIFTPFLWKITNTYKKMSSVINPHVLVTHSKY